MKEYLEGFSKRMEFVAVVDSLTGRVNKNQEIERLFQPGELSNILMSVLVFIMEMTLAEDQSCTLEAITDFIGDILPSYSNRLSRMEQEALARYLVKDILQNKGEMRSYPVMDYTEGMHELPIRLVADKLEGKNLITYELTKQGYDFLFRTKEVDDELGFQIETVRLSMLIGRKNYKKALTQSLHILHMLREKRNEMGQFELELRHDIFSVSGERYDEMVRGVDAMLHEEYDMMRDIERMLALACAHLDEENRLRAVPDKKSLAARQEAAQIADNVQRALGLQRELLIKCDSLRKLYLTQLEDSLAFRQVRRFDLKEQILEYMERCTFSETAIMSKLRAGLLMPLFLPDVSRGLNLSLVYDRQAKLKESLRDEMIEEYETSSDDSRLIRIKARNDAHVRLISLLLGFAVSHPQGFMFSEFWESIKSHKYLPEMTAERLIFLVMLKLYEIREIDLVKWRMENTNILECSGEFDLNYCLSQCFERDKGLFSVERLVVDRTDEWFYAVINNCERIVMEDLHFEVRMNEADSADID